MRRELKEFESAHDPLDAIQIRLNLRLRHGARPDSIRRDLQFRAPLVQGISPRRGVRGAEAQRSGRFEHASRARTVKMQ